MYNENLSMTSSCGCRQINKKTDDVNVGEVERVLSAALGTGMVVIGLRGLLRGRIIFSTILALTGAGLTARGYSGHCRLYQAMGIDSDDGGSGDKDEAPPTKRPQAQQAQPRRRLDGGSIHSQRIDPVTEASKESFPASDAPAWGGGR